ncbi:arsenate reductase family protein [Flexithrix dorotheae]|uniref:arsenate reductase family protein n=1 Tax=Flexithrix dorotheae TaxID=70993 RepID=UPI00039D31DA|nr:hypothetical protein [Flexithrix dorotheae]
MKNEILFVYNSNKQEDKKALGYVKSMQHHKVKEFDVQKDIFTELQLIEIAQKLRASPEILMDKKADLFREKFKKKNLSFSDVPTVLRENPDLICTPILIYHDRAKLLDSAYELIKDDMVDKQIKVKKGSYY